MFAQFPGNLTVVQGEIDAEAEAAGTETNVGVGHRVGTMEISSKLLNE